MRHRRAVLLLLLLLTALPLGGCWDRFELEETAFILAVGVDKGQQSLYSVTFAIALPSKMAGSSGGGGGGGGGGGKDGKPYILTTVEAPTLTGALAMLDSYMDRRTSLAQTKALFMGEEMAKVSGMYTMDEFVRFREVRRSVFYIVTKGKASDFLHEMEAKMENDPQRFIEQITYNYRQTGMIPRWSQIQTFVSAVNTGYAQPLTYYAAIKQKDSGKKDTDPGRQGTGFEAGDLPRTGGPNIEMLGAAAFRGERMVGTLTGGEMRMALLMQDQFQSGFFSIPDPQKDGLFVSMKVRRSRPFRLTVDLSGSRPRLTGLITLESEVLAIQSNVDYMETAARKELEQATKEYLETHIQEVLQKTQKWNADIVGFGDYVVRKFSTVKAWDAYNWPDRYQDADIQVQVAMTIRRFGLQISPPRTRQ